MSGPAALSVRGIAHRFGGRWVLRGIDLDVAEGEAVALMGANGTGKTTLLRIVSTLLRPSRGEGGVFGYDLRREPDLIREQVAYFGYLPALYEDLTAAENLEFSCRMRGQRPDRAAIAAVLDEVGLASHVQARVRGFSSGMRRRVSLARVLLQRPRLLLLDEPYAALDDAGIELVDALVARVKGDAGVVLAATHDLPRTGRIIDRVVRIERGVLADRAELLEEAGVQRGFWTPRAVECR